MIPKTFEDAYSQVKGLAERFAANETAYLSPKYQEAEVRQDFLDKFWVALGWDVYHQEHPNPYEREVKIEKSVIVGDRGKRADYAFYTRPNFLQARFMAEAKKPARQLENQYDCFQAMRYGWNSNTPLAVLTDFEQFLILDSRYKPTVEKAANGIIEKFHYSQFTDEEAFRKIYYLFSREAVGDGSLEKFIQTLKKAKTAKAAKVAPAVQIQQVGDTFLTELDVHRDELARGFKRNNAELDGDELTEITQRTLDRLVFIRFLEDKLVEPSEIIDRLGVKTGSKWRDFANEMPRLNSVYNGIIFKPHAILDSPDFQPDEKAFSDTLTWLSHKNSPYDFNTIPIHILGSIYERFLGKTIVVTDKRAKLEEKPEVRKAGGVYYTPEYIVRYIVENTIGRLLSEPPALAGGQKDKRTGPPLTQRVLTTTPDEIAKMRFADIACGSGSFLLGIFDYLIKYHVEWYSANKTRREDAIKKGLCRETSEGNLQLTIPHKRDILLNNIYGVDLDAQAVEVAQLSLYLKLLEEETTATAQQYLAGFREQLLPPLNNNIVHGNSLIDYDIMDGQLFDSKDLKKLNPMSFQSTFPEIFANGGFDAIVGNPPYGAELEERTKSYITKHYQSYKYKYDSYIYFIERAFKLTKTAGFVGFITPEVWLKLESTESLRRVVAKFASFSKLKLCGENVFAQAVVNTIIPIFKVGVSEDILAVERDDEKWEIPTVHWQESKTMAVDYRIRGEARGIIERIEAVSQTLITLGDVVQGITAYDKYRGQSPELIKSRAFHFEFKKDDTCGKWLGGSDVTRYEVGWSGEWLSYGPWLAAAREPRFFEGERILFREIPGENKRIQAALTNETSYYGHSITPFKLAAESLFSLNYLLAIANSKLISWYGRLLLPNFGKDIFPKLNPKDIAQLPIRTIDFNNPAEKAMHDRMVDLVEKMIDGKKKLAEARTDSDRALFERLCNSLDTQIDGLVYQLYDITPDERKIIEGS